MKQFLQINPADTVAVALQDLPGIPAGHKFALRDIAAGEDIIKYGNPIGHATRDIRKGELVDHHNIATNLSGTLDYSQFTTHNSQFKISPSHCTITFLGFPRPNGQVGIRNDIWIIPTVGCVNGICRQIVEQATSQLSIVNCQLSINYFPHNYGCSQLGDDHENTRLILRDIVLHPNAGGVLVVGLGCENNQPREFEKMLGDYDRQRIRFLICQEVEGDEVEAGVKIVKELYEQAQKDERVSVPISKLRVGLKCGGSDGFSGITANPLLGAFSDWLCAQGGTTILTEVPEMFGAEHLLMRRAISDDVLQDTIRLINDFKEYYLSHGQPVGENPSPGNKAGGISTLEEKALGCTQKSGTSPVCGVLKYGETLTSESYGLHLLCAPGNDLVASTALAAAGCQMVLFTTGRGTPFSTFVPTLKVSTNSDLAKRKPQWIDFDAGVLLEKQTMDETLHDFCQLIIDVANGHPVHAEQAGTSEISIWKNGVTL
jgi:altronate hydrolase